MSLAPALEWQLLPFDALTTGQLHELLQLRSAVFVVEQACAFQDIDGADPQALHLLGTHAGQLLAYARCFAPGIKFAEVSIGRVVTDPAQRQRIVDEDLVAYLHDGVDAWDLLPDGTYARVKPPERDKAHGAQAALMGRYAGRLTEGEE